MNDRRNLYGFNADVNFDKVWSGEQVKGSSTKKLLHGQLALVTVTMI